MKTAPNPRSRSRAYVSVAMVAAVAVLTTFSLAIAFSHSISSQDFQSRSQVRSDFAQKEDAVLRSLITILPNKAIGVMQDGATGRADSLSWDAIFAEALDMANAEHAIDSVTMQHLGITNYISGNSGDHNVSNASTMVGPVIDSDGHQVDGGTVVSSSLLFDSRFGTKLPDPLEAPSAVMAADRNYPIISHEKLFASGWTNDAQLSITDFPLYNKIAYPDVRFGYERPGDPFIAKRNWWAFSIRFGQSASGLDMPLLTRNYVVSIYEVPSQQPISAEAFMSVGRHSNGELWSNSAIDGGISAGIVRTEGSFDLLNGNISGRSGVDLGSGTTVRGEGVANGFDALGVREASFASGGTDQQLVSLAGNSGRVAFIPINRGLSFYTASATADTNTISPTTWNKYSRGADQCAMRVEINEVEGPDNQTPTRIRWYYTTPGGGEANVTLERMVNWPWEGTPGSDLVPFQTENLENGRNALVVHTERLAPYLASIGGGSASINNSLVINVDPSLDSDVKLPEFPTVSHDACVVLRSSHDFSAYDEGFSLVTNMRLYFADDFNTVSVPAPANAGLPAGQAFFPPVSIFAPEKRYGTTLVTRPVVYTGQVGSLAEGEATALHPLDFRVGTYDTVSSSLISTDLREIVSPAELPPIHLMNWLVTIEEIR